MPLFTALVAIALPALAGTFAGSVVAAGLALATSIGVSYVMKALAGEPEKKTEGGGVQGTLAAGGDVPRSFGLGTHMTAGSLVYANYWGHFGETPNAYFTQVIALSDLPGEQLLEIWVQGEKCTINTSPVFPEYGNSLTQYASGGLDHLWVKYYDGTQVAADPFLTSKVSSTDRPYGATRIGTGVCYAIVTSLVEDKLFSGFPAIKFVLSGIPLYDPSKDSTNGGSGSQRYSNPATWGGDGDALPAVQAYNILRGIRYAGAWLYGLQNMVGAARLPAANWNAQIAKCRASVIGLSGPEPSYRAGGQINVDSQPANAIEALLTACQGRLSEIGGFYKIHLGAPDSASFAWTDANLLSSEQQIFRPFFSLSDSVNGIQGTYPDPAQGWETATAPPLYRSDLEVRDGNRRLMAAPSFDFVPYPEQVQRLQKSGLEEAQRARTHVLPLPPAYWVIEPGDVGSWNSFRNGYVDKLFRVDSVVDRANLDVALSVTEIDPADYDWDHVTDYTGVVTGSTVFPRPQPQGVIDWYAEGAVLYDADGLGRRAAIRIAWDGTLPGVVGVQYEVRLGIDLSHVTRGRTDQLQAGALLISQGIIETTAYQVRGQYLPSSPRDMLWSDWLDVTTPDLPALDIPAWISVQVTTVMDYLNDRIAEVEQRFATLHGTIGQRNWIDQKEIRSQLSSRSDAAFAEISHVETVSISADAALATSIDSVNAKFGPGFSSIDTVAEAFADNAATFATYSNSVSAQFGTTNANVSTNAGAIATLEGYAAARYAVTLDVNGYASGFTLINGGTGFSTATFVQDKFQVALPGVGGGAAVPVFTIANVGGTPKIAIRGDMYADGTIAASRIIAGSITATQIAGDSITADRLVTGTITSDSGKIGALSVKSLSIGDNAATVPVAQNYSTTLPNTDTTLTSFNISVDTTGLSGRVIGIYAMGTATINNFGTNNTFIGTLQMNGSDVQSVTLTGLSAIIASFSWKIDITGTGGVVTIPVLLHGQVGIGSFTCSGSLFALACKR